MSTIDNISQRTQDFVSGYCHDATCSSEIPLEIINLCIIFLHVGEEFDAKTSNKSLSIEGASNTIWMNPKGKSGICVGSNIISAKQYTFYHWRLSISQDESLDAFRIGIVTIDPQLAFHTFQRPFYGQNEILDLYVSFEANEMCLYPEDREWSRHYPIDRHKDYRLAISAGFSAARNNRGSVEIVSFHAANPKLSDPVNLALSIDAMTRKLDLFEMAIKSNSRAFTHADEYVKLLLIEREHDKAYDFILAHHKTKYIPIKHIASIASEFYHSKQYVKAEKMFDLIDDDGLKEVDLMDIKASNYQHLGQYENASKYYDFCLANTSDKRTKSFCLGSMALLYDYKNATKESEISNVDESILRTKKALEYEPDEPVRLSNLGYFYFVKGNYAESYKCLTKSIEVHPYGTLVNGNMANLLYAMNRYDESIPFFEESLAIYEDRKHPEVGPKCLENYANVLYLRQRYKKSNEKLYELIWRHDFGQHPDKNAVYWLMSRNFEKMRNIKKAIQYVKKAQAIKPECGLYASKLKKLRHKRRKYQY